MSEHMHFVTVTPGKLDEDDWQDEATVKFECRGDDTADCHQYPECDCGYWEDDDAHYQEHPKAAHQECWMQGWFESEVGHIYHGPDFDDRDETCVPRDMDRSGPIKACYDIDGFVEWEFAS